MARVIKEPQSTTAWKQGARGEVRTGERLAKLLGPHGVRILHDRRIPGHAGANIDHLTVGPGGVTVIDTKTHRGKVSVERIGGLISPRHSVLKIGGRDQTKLIDGVERQIEQVRHALARMDHPAIDIRGALCFPNVNGLPILSRLSVRDILIDGSKPVAKLARRPGPLHGDAVELLWTGLGRAFPPA
jgi:hypothetical protein